MSDLSMIKGRQREMWAAGDYAAVATPLLIVSELLCEAADLRAGSKVLDVATGSGNTALGAARRRCEVTAVDYVPSLLQRARERAAVERLDIRFWLDYFRSNFGPTLQSFERLDADAQKAFAADLMALAARFNRSGDDTFVAPGEYLEVILTV